MKQLLDKTFFFSIRSYIVKEPKSARRNIVLLLNLTPNDRRWLSEQTTELFGAPTIVSRGVLYNLTTLRGFIAWRDDQRLGAVLYRLDEGECELVLLFALKPWRGVGSALLQTVETKAREVGCQRIWLLTTNDNLDAIRFYQRRGYRLKAVYPNAMQRSRELKPQIPQIGEYGIPIRDEIELEKHIID